MCWDFADRPSVTTGGCSHRSKRSPILPSIRAAASSRCRASDTAYGARPRWATSSSRMYPTPEGIETRFGDGLGQRRMRVDEEVDLFDRKLVLPRHAELVNQLGRVRADDMRAQDLAILGFANDLDESLGLTRGPRPAGGREREFADAIVDLLRFADFLGHADRRHLGVAVRGIGNVAIVHGVWILPGNALGDHDAFTLALVGEHWRAGDVADRV